MRKISEIAKSIQFLHENSEIEKKNLFESIEFMWLNAEVQKKKKEFQIPKGSSDENIHRIRQLLASAWFEDFKN